MNAKFAAVTVLAFGIGLACGRFGGNGSGQLKGQITPADGLWLDDVVFMDGVNTVKRFKIATISHETPYGVVRHGRVNDADISEDTAKISGTFCGDKITAYGFVKEDRISLSEK